MYNAPDIVGIFPEMVKQYRDVRWVIAACVMGLALTLWLALMHEFRLDDSFITYRYARNVARGWGLVYNQGEVVLSTTAPLYALLLALLSRFIPDFHILGGLIGTICTGLGGSLLIFLLPGKIPLWIRGWAGVVYGLSMPLWLSLGLETSVWILLVLLAIWAVERACYMQSGLLMGCAILVRPDAALPGALLGLLALGISVNAVGTTGRWWFPVTAYTITAALPVVLYGVWAWQTYGSPLPATLSAKSAQAFIGITGFGVFVDAWTGLRLIVESLLSQSVLYISFGILMLLGLRKGMSTGAVLAVLWAALHFAAYKLLGVAPYRWYYAALLPGTILLAAYGLYHLFAFSRQMRYAAVLLAVMPLGAQGASIAAVASVLQKGGEREVMLPIVDWQAYREAGEWLNAQTPPDAVVGVAEVGQIGFYADRYMTDYLGLLQPDVAALVRRGDLYSWLVGYAPDYLVFQRFGGKVGLALYNYFIEYDPWFALNYHEVAKFDDPRYLLGPVVIYQRQYPVERAVAPEAVDVDFGLAHLRSLAVDVQQNAAARIRLDWQTLEGLPSDLHIHLALGNVPDETTFDGDYSTDQWPEILSTWHSLVFPENLSPGNYPLSVSIGNSVSGYISRPVSELKIRSP